MTKKSTAKFRKNSKSRVTVKCLASVFFVFLLKNKKKKKKLDMEQQTGSKLEKDYVKAVYCHPAYLTYMQNTLCKMLGWMKLKLESRFPEEISTTSDKQRVPL